MGADRFFHMAIERTASKAFIKARDQAAYDHGHSGYTGTIAEKGDYVYAGQVNSHSFDRLEQCYLLYERWLNDPRKIAPGGKSRHPVGIPNSLLEPVAKTFEAYNDKWGPAVCYELTGRKAVAYKAAAGYANTMMKVWVFLGWASS